MDNFDDTLVIIKDTKYLWLLQSYGYSNQHQFVPLPYRCYKTPTQTQQGKWMLQAGQPTALLLQNHDLGINFKVSKQQWRSQESAAVPQINTIYIHIYIYIYYIDITLGQKVPGIRVYRECTKSKQRYRILVICIL